MVRADGTHTLFDDLANSPNIYVFDSMLTVLILIKKQLKMCNHILSYSTLI